MLYLKEVWEGSNRTGTRKQQVLEVKNDAQNYGEIYLKKSKDAKRQIILSFRLKTVAVFLECMDLLSKRYPNYAFVVYRYPCSKEVLLLRKAGFVLEELILWKIEGEEFPVGCYVLINQ